MNINKTFFLNGYQFLLNKDNITLNEILQYFNYQNSLFIVEYNNLICNQAEWAKIKIDSNDKIEVITIVGGG